MTSYEQVLGGSKEKLSFNRKKPLTEPQGSHLPCLGLRVRGGAFKAEWRNAVYKNVCRLRASENEIIVGITTEDLLSHSTNPSYGDIW